MERYFQPLNHRGTSMSFQRITNIYGTIADLGGGAGADTPLQRFDPLPTQRVPPLYYFEIFIVGDGP